MISYKDFSVWYKIGINSKKNVLENTGFSIHKNEITGLIGLNGEGKTSLIKAVLGLNKRARYNLYIDSNKKGNLNINKILRMSYVPEIPSNESNFTVHEYLKLITLINTDKNKIDIGYLLDHFKLNEYLNQKFSVISKGTKKRVLIVAALLTDWEFIVLDEPFEGLDIVQRDVLKNLLLVKKKDRYVLISSHEILELKQFCNTIIKVHQKKVTDFFNV